MERLTRSWLADHHQELNDIEVGDLSEHPVKVLQFGEGNFLRAFVDWMFDELNARGRFQGNIAVVQPIRQGIVHMLKEQDGLYTLLMRGIEQGEVKQQRRLITSITQGLQAHDEWSAVKALAASDDLRVVVSNTTEAGICWEEANGPEGDCPGNFPAKIAQLLYARYRAVQGDPQKGLILIPCELIDRNGDKLKEYVLRHAEKWNLESAFSAWVKEANHFLNTLVDRIVPGYPREEAKELCTELGYDDQLLDTGEVFHLWVIEGPQELAEELPFHEIGLNVVWTDNLEPYRTRKVRILNGAHTSCVLAAYHCGHETVGEMMEDESLLAFMKKVLFTEVLPTIALPEDEKIAFAEAILERFRNPFIKHQLLSISLNSVSKWKVRVLPSLLDNVEAGRELPSALAFSLAALLYFYRGSIHSDGRMQGERDGVAYDINDDVEVCQVLADAWKQQEAESDTAALVRTILQREDFWGRDLTAVAGLADAVTSGLNAILDKGMKAAIQETAGVRV